eukprot:jgi/Mesen1/1818/ME000141S00989
MAVPGFYRRVLPTPPAVDFTSPRGKELFREALAGGTMEGFFVLIANYQTQAEAAFCGLASLAVALNALAIDPGRPWKGDRCCTRATRPLSAARLGSDVLGGGKGGSRCGGDVHAGTRNPREATCCDSKREVVYAIHQKFCC